MFRPLRIFPEEPKFDFMKYHRIFAGISLALVVASILLIGFKGLNFGIDFSGGILMEVRAPQAVDLAQMRDDIEDLGLGEIQLQEFGQPQDVLIRMQRQEGSEAEQAAAVAAVKEALGDQYEYRRTEFVGPKVGDELIVDAIWALLLAIGGIMLYIWFRYEWQFAINAIVALLHDCVTTVGLFALLGLDFNLATVAAVLTIAGYSVNDTVVIYDRIRTEMRRYKKMSMPDLLNLSLNRTLSRTVNTSGLTLLSVVALLIFGGDVLRNFSIALTWGMLVGVYSTIYVATPLLLYMNLRGVAARMAREAEAVPDSRP
ncbi:MAG: protein translocase subunit SecF [Dongiaceae bacterium]